MKTMAEWKTYWSRQNLPLHRFDTPEFYRICAKELKILFGDGSPNRVLEIGCGNGALFEFLGFDNAKYRGVDFSPRLLAAFRSKHPNVDLVCHEGSSYVDKENKYDLVFSSGVVQYFDLAMLDRHFACVHSMAEKDSLFVCASIPRRLLRSKYDSGGLTDRMETSILTALHSKIYRSLFGDPMGHWHKPREIAALADKHGFSAEFYGSMTHLYRFHAVMKHMG